MENINSMLVNDIVKDFQHPAFGIEAEQKMFVLVFGEVNLVFKNPVGKCTTNIRLANLANNCARMGVFAINVAWRSAEKPPIYELMRG